MSTDRCESKGLKQSAGRLNNLDLVCYVTGGYCCLGVLSMPSSMLLTVTRDYVPEYCE